jgi:citrate synthase
MTERLEKITEQAESLIAYYSSAGEGDKVSQILGRFTTILADYYRITEGDPINYEDNENNIEKLLEFMRRVMDERLDRMETFLNSLNRVMRKQRNLYAPHRIDYPEIFN